MPQCLLKQQLLKAISDSIACEPTGDQGALEQNFPCEPNVTHTASLKTSVSHHMTCWL